MRSGLSADAAVVATGDVLFLVAARVRGAGEAAGFATLEVAALGFRARGAGTSPATVASLVGRTFFRIRGTTSFDGAAGGAGDSNLSSSGFVDFGRFFAGIRLSNSRGIWKTGILSRRFAGASQMKLLERALSRCRRVSRIAAG